MITPAQAHFESVMAARRNTGKGPSQQQMNAYEMVLLRLRKDMARLKLIQSNTQKATLKKEIIPAYLPWIDGAISADTGAADEIITTIMIWCTDCRDIAQALRIGEYVIRHKLPLPDRYRRTAATALVDEICDPVLAAFTADPADVTVSAELLEALRGLTENEDMPDEVRAKLYKALGYTLRLDSDPQSQADALKWLQQATVLNPKKAGVKRDIELLQRAAKRNAPSVVSEPLPEGQTAGTVPASPAPEKPAKAAAKKKTTAKAAAGKTATRRKTAT